MTNTATKGSKKRRLGVKLSTARQVPQSLAQGPNALRQLFQFARSIFSDSGALSTNANTPGQHTPVAFGTKTGWNNRGRTKGWNRGVTLSAAGGQPQRADTSYTLQNWTGNPYAGGYSGGSYAGSAARGGTPLELQPNPLTVQRAQGQKARAPKDA